MGISVETRRDIIKALQRLMKQHDMDAYIVPMFDDHISEYVGLQWKRIEYLSGFTGSAGTLIIGRDATALWADGRYFIQAAEEIADTGIEMIKDRLPDSPTHADWIMNRYGTSAHVAADGRTLPIRQAEKLEEVFDRVTWDEDLISSIWTSDVEVVGESVFLHEEHYTGETTASKLAAIRKQLTHDKEAVLLSALDDVAYTLNIRGTDVPFNPVVYSFLYLTKAEARLFVDRAKLPDAVLANLVDHDVTVNDYDDVYRFLSSLDPETVSHVRVDGAFTNVQIRDSIGEGVRLTYKDSPVLLAKAVRNETQIRHMHQTAVTEGVAMTRLSRMIKERALQEKMTEYDLYEAMSDLRAQGEGYVDDGFPSIVGFGPNAAMMHYIPTAEKNAVIDGPGFVLVDTGGHYLGGTTDVTRTYSVGQISQTMKQDYTRVLISNIKLTRAVFLKGTSGSNLDILARLPMWEAGMDYKCGTGHGVGYLLSVHEGPQSFAITAPHVPLQPGMVITNEPGIYKDGEYGIRIENMLLVEDHQQTAIDNFYRFDAFSLCPIDLEPVVQEMLEPEDLEWLNAYHAKVYRLLSPHLEQDEAAWLKEATRAL